MVQWVLPSVRATSLQLAPSSSISLARSNSRSVMWIGGALLGYDPPLDRNWWNIEPEEKDEE